MVVRDSLRSEDYYNAYIEKKNARIQQIEKVLHTVVEQRGAQDKGARNGYLFLANHYSTGSSRCIQPGTHWTRSAVSSPALSR